MSRRRVGRAKWKEKEMLHPNNERKKERKKDRQMKMFRNMQKVKMCHCEIRKKERLTKLMMIHRIT